MCLIRSYILRLKKLHISVDSGHHQILSFDSLNIIPYNSRHGVFDDDISTSKPSLQHSVSIFCVWVNHVIILKSSLTLYYRKQNHDGPVLGKALSDNTSLYYF